MRWVVMGLVVALVAGCGTDPATVTTDVGADVGALIELPEPRRVGDHSLEEALAARRSIRDFSAEPLDDAELSQLLWATQGVTAERGGRTAPSAGALYPLEIYLVTAQGWFHYAPNGHHLVEVGVGDVRPQLAAAALGQGAVAAAAAVFVVTAVYERTAVKYGARAERYVHLEAGHAAQNLLLQAVADGLAAVPIGAFVDADVQSVLTLPADHEPLYLVPVGYPQTDGAP